MAFLSFRSFYLGRLLYSTVGATNTTSHVLKNTLHTCKLIGSNSFPNLSAVRRSFASPSKL